MLFLLNHLLYLFYSSLYIFFFIFFFFFSSRRRHTRCLSDWSSDVCSSDLPWPRLAYAAPQGGAAMAQTASRMTIAPIHPCFGARVEGVDLGEPLNAATFQQIFDAFQEYSVLVFHRSEERRAGKDGRCLGRR